MLHHGHFKGLQVQQNAVKHSVLKKLLRLRSLGPKIAHFPNNTLPQTTVSICYALSLHRVYKLVGKLINLLECLAFSCNKATPWEVFMVLVSLKGGGRGGGVTQPTLLKTSHPLPPPSPCPRLLNLLPGAQVLPCCRETVKPLT